MTFTVVLVDDQPVSRENHYSLLARDQQIFIDRDWCFDTPESLLQWLQTTPLRPDVIFFDMEYGGRHQAKESLYDLLCKLRQLTPRSAIICMADYESDHLVQTAIRACTSGFVLRRDISYGVPALVHQVANRSFICSPTVKTIVQHHLPRQGETNCIPCWQLYSKMTPAERTVAEYLFIRGLTAANVSLLVNINQDSVPTYKQRIKRKVRYALEEGYYNLPNAPYFEHKSRLTDADIFHVLTRLPLAH